VVGVLVALAVDQWRADAGARTAESQYVRRLIVDLAADSAQAVALMQSGAAKAEALSAEMAALADTAALRMHPSVGWPTMTFTYTRPPPQTTTFDELTNTGSLALIRQDALRFAIGDTYRLLIHHYRRLDDRRTDIAFTVAELFPSAAWGSGPSGGMSPEELDSTFYADPGADERLRKLMSPEYRGLLNQERIYAMSMEEISEDMLGLIIALLQELRGYEGTLN